MLGHGKGHEWCVFGCHIATIAFIGISTNEMTTIDKYPMAVNPLICGVGLEMDSHILVC